jgi:exonuclease VII large subunit
MKICIKCKIEKSLNEFHKNTNQTDGVHHTCKQCLKKYYEENKEKLKKNQKNYYEENKEKIAKRHRNWSEKNKPKRKKYQKQYYTDNKKTLIKYKKEYYVENKEHMLKNQNTWLNSKALYEFGKSISWHDYTECSYDGYLIVKCKYCGKKFTPKVKNVKWRSLALNTHGTDTQAIYCSSGCKIACPVFGRQKNYKGQKIEGSSREVQPELRQMCLERDNYTCQKCGAKGKTIQLHCHHIKAVAEDPIESADVDNTITLCKDCHKLVHKIPGCHRYELRC